MANDNETVDQVCEEMKEVTGTRRFIDSHYCNHCGDQIDGEGSALDVYSDRILAAHKREMMHNESLLQKAGATVVELMNTMSAQHEEIKKLRGLVVLLTSALERATVMRCIMADSGIPCKDLLDNNSCGAENCKSMCGRWRELIDKAKKEVTK